MRIRLLLAGLLAGMAAGAGCGGLQMDSSRPEDLDANRLATGTVEMGDATVLPADATVTVRVVDIAHHGYHNENAAALGQATATQGVTLPPQVIGEQRIGHPRGPSIPYAVRFNATDEQMAGGLVLEARVSFGGSVRYFNVESYAVNSANIGVPRRIDVNGIR